MRNLQRNLQHEAMLPAPTFRPCAIAAGCPPRLAAWSPAACAQTPLHNSRSHSRAPLQPLHALAELSLADPVIDEALGLAVTPRGDEDFCGDAGALNRHRRFQLDAGGRMHISPVLCVSSS